MNGAWLGVAAAALCSGSAAVLQTVAVSKLPVQTSINAGFLRRLARSPRYLLALVLIGAGFLLSLVALRSLPLFVVQAGRASSLAVTAVLSVLVLRSRLRLPEATAVGAVIAGLVLVGLSAAPQRSIDVSLAVRVGLLLAVLVVGFVAALLLRTGGRGMLLGTLAGGGFAVLALGARIVADFAPAALIADPAAWAAATGGALGLLLGALALQRASVVTVTSAMVGTETVLSAVLGMLISGDRPLPGREATAVAGFVVVVAGALLLARFGAPDHPAAQPEEPGALPIG